jgi:hypothetical protein
MRVQPVVSILEQLMYTSERKYVHIVSRKTLINYYKKQTKSQLEAWYYEAKNANWKSPALSRIDELMDAESNTSEGDELELLVTLVELYEDKKYPIEMPDRVNLPNM